MKTLPIVEAAPMTTRCTGHCCRDTVISGHSVRSLRALALREAERAIERGIDRVPDSVKAAAMFRPLVGEAPDRRNENGEPIWYTEADNRFRCIHLDDATGNCNDYENRPDLCREYPYGHACEYSSCTWNRDEAVEATLTDWQRSQRKLSTAAGLTQDLSSVTKERAAE